MASDNKTITVTNCTGQLTTDLSNIAANIGLQRSQFIKMKLKEVADSYPPEMKKERKKD